MELIDKRVLITGGSSGIGSVLAKELYKQGAKVFVLDSNLNQDLVDSVNYIHCDISNLEEVGYAFDLIDKGFIDKIDILINNAAITRDNLLYNLLKSKAHSIDAWKKVFDVNLNGLFYITRGVVERMIKLRTTGLIINVSSIVAAGNPGQSAYAASKAAVESLTVTWAAELAHFKIRVAGIAPGFINAGITSRMPENLQKMWSKKTPLNRFAKVQEIIDGFLFIIKNDFYNGEVLKINGGLRV